MKIVLATDHAGFEALKQLKQFLESLGHICTDLGPSSYNADDDYPDFILPAAYALGKGEYDCGIIFGGSGQGEAMAANRVKGVRCTVFYGPVAPRESVDISGQKSDDPYEILRLSRSHNHANMLSLASRFLSDEQIKRAAEVWLAAPYSEEARHIRRIKKLDEG